MYFFAYFLLIFAYFFAYFLLILSNIKKGGGIFFFIETEIKKKNIYT